MTTRTTIQLDEETKKILDKLKKEKKAKSYAAVIRELAKNAKTLNKKEQGTLPELKAFQREKHDRLN